MSIGGMVMSWPRIDAPRGFPGQATPSRFTNVHVPPDRRVIAFADRSAVHRVKEACDLASMPRAGGGSGRGFREGVSVTKAMNKRRPKADVLRELDEQTARGQQLRNRSLADELELEWASVE